MTAEEEQLTTPQFALYNSMASIVLSGVQLAAAFLLAHPACHQSVDNGKPHALHLLCALSCRSNAKR